MIGYYLELAVRSLRRNPVLTALMVIAIGVGVAASMTTYAVFRAVSGNPMPDKSSQLFVPQIDNWGPQGHRVAGDLPDTLSYIDAMALMHAHEAKRQTAIYQVAYTLVPGNASNQPFTVNGYAAFADFFPMFNVPFRFGTGWNSVQDDQRANAIVISSQLNQQMFGGGNSVGRTLNLDGHDYRVMGVIADWNPLPRFYATNNGFGDAPDFFLPLTHAIDLQTGTSGGIDCSGTSGQAPGWGGLLHSECAWVSFWTELPDAAAVRDYRSYLEGYAAEQQRAGRFHWAPNVRLYDLMQWLDHEQAVPPETLISLLIALSFLLVCLVNTIGLLLAKFMRRALEIGVRRALGASRREIYIQFMAEAAMVGVAGGVLGMLLTGVGVLSVGLVFEPEIAQLAHIDLSLVGLTMLMAIAATLIASFYPTWRATRVQPAWQLKSN